MIVPLPAQARPTEARPDVLLTGYVAVVVLAEAIGVFGSVTVGLVLHAALIIVLIGRQIVRESSLPLAILALPSLLRLLSFTMPIPALPVLAWYPLVGIPLIAACALAGWSAGWRLADIGVRLRLHRSELFAIVMGLPLGWAASQAYPTTGINVDGAAGSWLVAGVVLVAFVAIPEEVLFRGMIQRVFSDQLGGAGVVLTAILFAGVYLPSLSPGLVLVMAVAGLTFGWSVRITGNLGGALGGHALMIVSGWVIPGAIA